MKTRKVSLTVMINPDFFAILESFQNSLNLKSRGEALELLMKKGISNIDGSEELKNVVISRLDRVESLIKAQANRLYVANQMILRESAQAHGLSAEVLKMAVERSGGDGANAVKNAENAAISRVFN